MVLKVLGGPGFWGGGERVVLDLAMGLRDIGHRVMFAAPEGGALARFREAGFRGFAVPLRSPFVPAAIGRLAAIMRGAGVQIVHCHERRAAMAGFPAALLAGVPIRLLHVHRIASNRGSRRSYALSAQILSRFAQRTIFCSEFVRRTVKPRRDRGDVVIPNCVAFGAEPGARCGPRSNGPVVLAIGRLTKEKGMDVLLRALPQVVKRFPGVRVRIAGDGDLRDRLMALSRRLGLDEYVAFLGFRRDVPELMAQADLMVMPSRWEGLPIALLEAVAAGLPVVASAVAGIPEVIADGETGWLVQPDDPEALAAAISEALLDPAEARRRAQLAYARDKAEFSIKASVARVDRLYRELARARGIAVG